MAALVNFISILHFSRTIHKETTSLKEGVGNDLPHVIQSTLGSVFPKQNVELVTLTGMYWVTVKNEHIKMAVQCFIHVSFI